MISLLFYLVVVAACALFLVLSALALVVCMPFDGGRRVVHELSRAVQRVFFCLPPGWRTRVEGLEHIDARTPYVIVVNHQSMVDIPALYWLPLNFRWVSKREVFRTPLIGQYLVLHGDIAIERGARAEAMAKVIREGKEWLGRGVSVAIFPEGTRSGDGSIHRFKAGAFALAHEASVGVLPVVLEGTQNLFRGWRLPWRHRFTVRVLPAVDAQQVARTEVKELSELVRARMIEEQARLRALQ